MHVTLLHNVKAGDVDFTQPKLERLLKDAGMEPHYFPLKKTLNDDDLFEEALDDRELVVVAGGDGSVRKVATRLAGSKHVLAPLPIGTANNIAHSLGILGSPQEVAAGWKHGQKRKIDLGIAKGPWGKRPFIEGLGLGLIGRTIAIVQDIDAVGGRAFTTKEDRMHRDLCVMAALAYEMSPTEVKVTLHGDKTVDEYLLLEILNIGRAGPGIQLSEASDPFDGRLDLVWATARDRRALAGSIEKSLAESKHGPTLTSVKVRDLRISVGKCELRLDDRVVLRSEDFRYWTKGRRVKIHVKVLPKAVTFLIPRPLPTAAPTETKSQRKKKKKEA